MALFGIPFPVLFQGPRYTLMQPNHIYFTSGKVSKICVLPIGCQLLILIFCVRCMPGLEHGNCIGTFCDRTGVCTSPSGDTVNCCCCCDISSGELAGTGEAKTDTAKASAPKLVVRKESGTAV